MRALGNMKVTDGLKVDEYSTANLDTYEYDNTPESDFIPMACDGCREPKS